MRYLYIILIFLFLSCTKEDVARCYVVDYIEVEGELIQVGEFKCGCFPTSSPDGDKTFVY